MSPHYAAVRDGQRTAIPDEHLPSSYQAPAFRVQGVGGTLKQMLGDTSPAAGRAEPSDQSGATAS